MHTPQSTPMDDPNLPPLEPDEYPQPFVYDDWDAAAREVLRIAAIKAQRKDHDDHD